MRPAAAIDAAHDHERQLAEQLAVRLGHVVAHHVRTDLGQAFAHAGPALQRLLAAVVGIVAKVVVHGACMVAGAARRHKPGGRS
jgi:hypothetical protein